MASPGWNVKGVAPGAPPDREPGSAGLFPRMVALGHQGSTGLSHLQPDGHWKPSPVLGESAVLLSAMSLGLVPGAGAFPRDGQVEVHEGPTFRGGGASTSLWAL